MISLDEHDEYIFAFLFYLISSERVKVTYINHEREMHLD